MTPHEHVPPDVDVEARGPRPRTDVEHAAAAGTATAACRSDGATGLLRDGILGLHRSAGNAVVAQMLGGLGATDGFAAIAKAVSEAGDQFYAHEECTYPTIGYTTKPHDHEGPDIAYGTVEEDGQWFAEPRLLASSNEGTNESWALAAGLHTVPGKLSKGMPVVMDLSQAVAARVAAAEDEHNDDFRYAKQEVLQAADNWLKAYLDDGPRFGPADTEDDVTALVDAKLNGALRAELGLTAVDEFEWANLHAYYARLGSQTDKRDQNGWHTFKVDKHREGERVRVVVSDGTTQIGVHPAETVIRPGELE